MTSEANAMGAMLGPDDGDRLAAELVREFLKAHWGSFDSARVSHKRGVQTWRAKGFQREEHGI